MNPSVAILISVSSLFVVVWCVLFFVKKYNPNELKEREEQEQEQEETKVIEISKN